MIRERIARRLMHWAWRIHPDAASDALVTVYRTSRNPRTPGGDH